MDWDLRPLDHLLRQNIRRTRMVYWYADLSHVWHVLQLICAFFSGLFPRNLPPKPLPRLPPT